MKIFSNKQELEKIKAMLGQYLRLPFSEATVPGSVMESVLAHARNGEALNTYDFVDVVDRKNKTGWQIKATKNSTPVTWKRAKIPHKNQLIEDSCASKKGRVNLGRTIIDFCNNHARTSMMKYGLKEIGLARLVIGPNNKAFYYERKLCSLQKPLIFNAEDFSWHWSKQKETSKKEQLPAFHGIYKRTGKKWWAWHGYGENQLHFTGESNWWPRKNSTHRFDFTLPQDEEKLTLDSLSELFDRIDQS